MFGFKKRYILKVWRKMREENSRDDCFESLDDFCNEAAINQDVEAREVYEWVTEWEASHAHELDVFDNELEAELPPPPQTKLVKYSPGKSSITPRVTPTNSTVTPTPNLLYQSDKLIEEISNFPANLLIATRPGAGKSTLTNAIIHQIISRGDNSEIWIVDPKTNKWLGLERSHQVVSYLSGNAEQKVSQLEKQINKISKLLDDRVEQNQQALRTGKRISKFTHCYLILDEWFVIYNVLLGGNEKHPLVLTIKDIVMRGRELLIHVMLVGQSHQCGEIGFTKSAREAFDYVCLGSSSSSFEPLFKFASDCNVVSNAKQRDQLNFAVEQGIQQCKRNRLAVVTLQGVPRVTIIPDLSYANRVTVDVPAELLQPCDSSSLPNFPTSSPGKPGKSPSLFGGSASGSNDDNLKTFYRLVTLLTEHGCNDTQIIEQGLSCRGRKFEQGRQALQKIREFGRANGW